MSDKSIHLRRFTPEEIIITEKEAKVVYKFFFKENAQLMGIVNGDKKFEHLHIEFAQALLVEGLDRSYDMGFLDILAKSIFNKKGAVNSASKIIKKFGKKAFKHWFEHATEDDLWDDAEIYETIRVEVYKKWTNEAHFILNYDKSIGY